MNRFKIKSAIETIIKQKGVYIDSYIKQILFEIDNEKINDTATVISRLQGEHEIRVKFKPDDFRVIEKAAGD